MGEPSQSLSSNPSPPIAVTSSTGSTTATALSTLSIAPEDASTAADQANRKRAKRVPAKRRTLSCLPCRKHKLKCDRHVPCHSCSRYRREDQCRQNPPPSSVMEGVSSAQTTSATTTIAPDIVGPYNKPTAPSASQHVLLDKQFSCFKFNPDSPDDNPAMLTVADFQALRANGTSTDLADSATIPNHTKRQGSSISLLSQESSGGTPCLAGTSIVPQFSPFLPSLHQTPLRPSEVASFWRLQLVSLLPSPKQCDLLVTYYMEHMNWVYHAVNVTSFHKAHARFWATPVKDIDLIWLSLLCTVLSCSAFHIPFGAAKSVELDPSTIRSKAPVWHSASRQALQAGGFESKPCLIQLETFLATQLYWLSTKNAEALNSALGQAVRNAQALGLDKDSGNFNCLERENRRRIWWELFNCDTFQSICLGRTPLIHTRTSRLPLPAHCNEADVTETFIDVKPIDEPTDMSGNILRAHTFSIFRKLFDNDSDYLSSYEYVKSVDSELEKLMAGFPWYFQINPGRECAKLPESLEFISWQHHMVHSCICMQRIRMNRPFIHARIGDSWSACAKAADEVLIVYQSIRRSNAEQFCTSQKFLVQGYQTFSAAVALAAFLLVERSFPADNIRKDIEMVISDLGFSDAEVSISADGRKILAKMLDMHDRRGLREQVEPESLVPEISSVFGGEQTARKYLKRCDIGYLLNGDPETDKHRKDRSRNGANSYDNDPRCSSTIHPTPNSETSTIEPSPGTSNSNPFSMLSFPLRSTSTTRNLNGIDENDLLNSIYSSDPSQIDLGFDILNCEQWDFLLPDDTFPLQ